MLLNKQNQISKTKVSDFKKISKGKRISTKFFWKELGISDYNCSDINKKSKIYIDLNYPLKNKNLNE